MERTAGRGRWGNFEFSAALWLLTAALLPLVAGCGPSEPRPGDSRAGDADSSVSDHAPSTPEASDVGRTDAGDSSPEVAPPVQLPPVKPVEMPKPTADEEFRRHVAALFYDAARIRSEAAPDASAVDIRLSVERKLAEADKLRAEASAYLLSLGGESVQKLKGAMLDPSVDVRRGAAWYLFENVNPGDPQMVAVFVQALEDKDPLVRRMGLAGLKGLPPEALEQFLPQLLKLLDAGQEQATDRAAIALLIGRIGPQAAPALPFLSRLVREDVDAKVRKQSLYAASRIATDAEAATMFQAALDDPDDDIRKMAVLRLGGLGLAASPAVASLAKSLKDKNDDVRWYAAQSLAKLGPHAASATGPLANALADPNQKVSRAAAQSLVTIGQPSVVPLMEQLSAANPRTRLLALAALGGLGPAAAPAIPSIRKLLDDKDPQVQAAAAQVLEVLGP